MDCIFCKISNHKTPASFVYEDDYILGIMSLDQPNPYKVLIIPRSHIENLYELSDQDAARIFQVTVKVARAIREASGCEGLNLVQSNGSIGQQDVFHFHLHLIPRFQNDDILLKWSPIQAERDKLNQMAEEIRSQIEN
ncbi:MAG TPA: HIT family protein [Pyrinomonadaceae bacterium]|jgi:histidine triad (HIT) family protein